jgi:hypothetical protein
MIFLVHHLPAFGRTLGTRIAKTPKTHLIDSGIAAHLLGVNRDRLDPKKPSTLTEFGHVVETFAVNEIIKQAGWSASEVTFSHLRTAQQQEVDLVVESRGGNVAGVEVKTSTTVKDTDFSGLRLMRDKLGEDFTAGVLLNFGQRSYQYEDRLYVVAMERLWSLRVDAELVAFGVLHDDPLGGTFLAALAVAGGAEGFEAFGLGLDLVEADVEVEVHAVLDGLGLGDLLEEDAHALPGVGARVEGVVGVADRPEGLPGVVAVDLGEEVLGDDALGEETGDERGVVLELVVHGLGPEGRQEVRVGAVDDDLEVNWHPHTLGPGYDGC